MTSPLPYQPNTPKNAVRGSDELFELYTDYLQKWRDEDNEDWKILNRNEVVTLLEGIRKLRNG
jgi:hypothetical protein